MIYVNGREETLDGSTCVEKLVEKMQLRPERIAVELNGEIVPKAKYAQTQIRDGDRIEVVSFVGGG